MIDLANIEMVSEKTIIQGIKDDFSIKKISLIIHLFFFMLALFLAQAVMFEAASAFFITFVGNCSTAV